jgi:hypothetical protein
MADEKPAGPLQEWFNKAVAAEPDDTRGYRPVKGPDEPDSPPPGRPSASPRESAPTAADSTQTTQQDPTDRK